MTIQTHLKLLLISWLFAGSCFATDVLVERAGYRLMQVDIDNMLAAGEHIATQPFTAQEKQQLNVWARMLFQREGNIEGVAHAFALYKSHLTQVQSVSDQAQQAAIWQNLYREMVFNWHFPSYPEQQQTLLDVIRRYNPLLLADKPQQLFLSQSMLSTIIPVAAQQQATKQEIIAAAVLLRQLQLNQQLFKRAMQTYREHGDHLSQSSRDLSTLQALGITYKKILATHDDYFLVEAEDGSRYKVGR